MLKSRRAADIAGSVDGIDGVTIHGWAMDRNAPDGGLDVAIVADGREIGRGRADQFRADLLAAGFGNGMHGFKVPVTDLSLPLLSVSVVASSTGTTRGGAALALDADLNVRIVRALVTRGRPAGLPDPVEDTFSQVSAGTFGDAGRDPKAHEKIYMTDELFVGALLAHAARDPLA